MFAMTHLSDSLNAFLEQLETYLPSNTVVNNTSKTDVAPWCYRRIGWIGLDGLDISGWGEE